MSRRVLIVGQGLAGTALGLELEQAGIDFAIASEGHAAAASRVAAGLVNPVTGQRWVKSARVDELLPVAREAYARWSALLGVELWHPLRLTRLWRDEEERGFVTAKIARGELAPYATDAGLTARGVTLAGAAWVDLPALLAAGARRWREQDRLRERRVEAADVKFCADEVEWGGERFATLVLCGGSDRLVRAWFVGAPFATAKGEILTVSGAGLAGDEGVSRGTWLLGRADGSARVGATYERERDDGEITAGARAQLLSAAELLAGRTLEVREQAAGVRLTLPDRLPIAGRHPACAALGIFGALGSKGSLWAPWLARIWSEHLPDATKRFPAEVSVARCPGMRAPGACA
jgi:glycine oxidase